MLSPAFRSQPALKNRSPAPVTIPTLSSASSRSRQNASYNARLVVTSIALAGGRSMVITSTCPAMSVLTGISPSSRAQQRSGNDQALDLAGTVPDPLHPRVPPPPLDRKLAHQSHPSEDLHGRVGQPAKHLRGVDLRHRGVGVGHPAIREPGGRAKRQQFGRLERSGHVGELEPDPLELSDRLPELDPGGGPAGRRLKYPASTADAGGRDRPPGGAKPLRH